LIETYKVRLSSKEETFKAQKKALSIEHDAAVALLKAQMDLKKKEAIQERSKACNSGRDLTNARNKLSKLQADIAKWRKDYNEDLHCQVCDTKSELTRVKKELTSTKKKIVEQLSSTRAQKERMKDKELEKEQIKFDKTKESSLSKLLSQERSHTNMLACTEHRYNKAKKVNGRLQSKRGRPILLLPRPPKRP
jgi:seryl-tRNA synthetase